MPQKLKVSGQSTPEEVTTARQTQLDPHDQERLLAIGMAQQGGWRIADIAAALGRGTATIGRWVRKFRSGGIPELLKRSHGARRAQLDVALQEALKEGLRCGKWKTAKEIRQFLQQEHGKKLSVSGVHYWLQKVKASCKLPRKQHAKQDPEQVQDFKQNVVNHLLALDIPPDKRLRVWISDEHRYGLIFPVRRCWTLKGHRPTAPVQMKYKWGDVSGAAEVIHGEVQFLYLPTVSLDDSQVFLQQ